MAKHTPGPWNAHSALLGYRGDVFARTAEDVRDCHRIARCFAPAPSRKILCDLGVIAAAREAIPIIEANARLIAAAPDLYEALDGLVSAQHGHGTACGCPWCFARAALATKGEK